MRLGSRRPRPKKPRTASTTMTRRMISSQDKLSLSLRACWIPDRGDVPNSPRFLAVELALVGVLAPSRHLGRSTTRFSTGSSCSRSSCSCWATSPGSLPCRPMSGDERPKRERGDVDDAAEPAHRVGDRDHGDPEQGQPAVDAAHEHRIRLNERPKGSSQTFMLDAAAAYPYRRFGQQKPRSEFSERRWLAGGRRTGANWLRRTRRLLQGSTPAALSVGSALVLQTSRFWRTRRRKESTLRGRGMPGCKRPQRIGRRECAAMRQRQQRRPVLFGSRSNADVQTIRNIVSLFACPRNQARDRSTVLPAW